MKRIFVTDKLLSLATMLAAVFSLTMFTACSEKEKDDPYIKSGDAGTTITAEGSAWAGWSTVIQSNIDQSGIQTTSSASWCTARLTASGNDTYQLQVSAEDNPTLSSRQAIITVRAVKGQAVVTFTVTQQAGKPYVNFKDGGRDVTIDAQAKSWERALDSNIEFSKLTAASSEKWCTVKLESTGSGITLKLEAQENETIAERKATITVKASSGAVNTSFVVTQQSASPTISFVDGGEDQTITPDGKSWTWEVSSNVAYSDMQASSDADWCTVELTQAKYTKTISLLVKVVKNETVNERKAVVTVKSTKYDTSTSFTVTQQPFGPSLVFTAGGTDQTISPDGKSWTWELSTNLKKDDLTASSTADWCTVELTGSDSRGISLSVKIAKNESINERKAVVTVKSTKYDTSISFTVTQQAAAPTITFSGSEGKDQTVTAVTKELVWTMQSNIPYNDLKVNSNESWCQIKLSDSNEAKDMKSYQLTITIAENPTDKQRQAVVTITFEKHNVSKSFMITQSAATFNSSHASVGFDRDGGNRTVTITSNASWKAECDADWVTLEQTNGYLTVRVKATTADRKATITFKDKTSTIITVNQTKYIVGEEYNEGGVTGTVAYIGDDKRFIYKNTGKTEPYQQFYLTTGTTGTYNMDDGEVNMQFIKRQSGWSGNYLAAAAVDDLNTGIVTGWYMPAINELKNMKAFVSGGVWSSTANNNGSFSAYLLYGGTVYSNEDRQMKHGVYAIRKF